MRTRLFILLLSFLCTSSFAQKYGVDLGCAYTINQFGDIKGSDPRIIYVQSELKQKIFPNISLRPYVKLYKKLYFYFGADLVGYKFKQSYYFGNDSVVDYGIYNYSRRLLISELHFPVMLRLELVKFKKKYPLSVYGGMFARFPIWVKERIAFGSNGYNSIPEGNYNAGIGIKEKQQRHVNFVGGVHQSIQFGDFVHGYVDFQLKYMSGDFYISPDPAGFSHPVRISNRLTFNFSIGISILKPEKENGEFVNPTRLED